MKKQKVTKKRKGEEIAIDLTGMPEKFPALTQFFGYFHQDWMEDFADAQAVIGNFVEVEPELAQPAIQELELLMSWKLDENQLRKIVLTDFGSYYAPPGLPFRDLLREFKLTLEKAVPPAS